MGISNTSAEPPNDTTPAARTEVGYGPLARSRGRTPAVLRLAAILLALFGIFPLGLYMGHTGTLEWWPGALADWLLSVPAVVGFCFLVAVGLGERADRLIARARALLLAPSPRAFGLGIAALVLLLSSYYAWYCFGGVPSAPDEMSQQFQAHLLLHGRLWMRSEPHPEFFSTIETITNGGRWFSQFPIGGAALLAIGDAVGAAWVVDPLLAAWTAWLFYRFCARVTGETTARGAALLFAASPFVLFMSASEMNHSGTLAFVMLAFAELTIWATADDSSRVRRAAACIGVAVGVAATIRPYDALLVAVVIGVFQLSVVRQSTERVKSLGWQIVAALVPVGLLLVVNWQTTGHPFLFGYDVLNGPGHRPGFHLDPTGKLFTPVDGVAQTSAYLLRLNTILFAGPIPAMLLIVATFHFARRPTRWDYLVLAWMGIVLAGYAAYWKETYFVLGPRFLFTAAPTFLFFAAKMPAVVTGRFRNRTFRRAITLLIPVATLVAWTLPAGAADYEGVRAAANATLVTQPALRVDIGRQIANAKLDNALVFVPESFHGRLSARLRALGLSALMAEGTVRGVDACALEHALDADDTIPSTRSLQFRLAIAILSAMRATGARRIPGLDGDAALSLADGKASTPSCTHEFAIDAMGTTQLADFLPYQGIDADGHVGGRVVFVRDLGARDELLRSRFGGRQWYRYRPPRTLGDTAAAFVPYVMP